MFIGRDSSIKAEKQLIKSQSPVISLKVDFQIKYAMKKCIFYSSFKEFRSLKKQLPQNFRL